MTSKLPKSFLPDIIELKQEADLSFGQLFDYASDGLCGLWRAVLPDLDHPHNDEDDQYKDRSVTG